MTGADAAGVGRHAVFPNDLIGSALGNAAEPWQHHVARGILADPRAALRLLESVDHPHLPFYRGVLSWLGGDEDTACRALEIDNSPAARRLTHFIRQPRIQVLTQIPFTGAGAFRLLEGVASDAKFEIRNIGRRGSDVPLEPYEPLRTAVPDASNVAFYVCAMIEWQHPPIDLPRLPFPTVGVVSDFDAQFMTVAPWLRAFDHVLVSDQEVEFRDVRALTSAAVHAFPLLFCAPTEAGPLQAEARDIDVLFTGTLFSPYQPDKAAIVQELLQVPGLRLVLIDGHVSHEKYQRLLARARITQNFCRHPGGMLTRALEALSFGSIALVQERSVHQVWGGRDEGVFTFQPGRLGEAVHEVLANYDRYGASCEAHVARFREMFSAATVASRFFRYATVLAAGGTSRRDAADAPLAQRRHVLLIGPKPTFADATARCCAEAARPTQVADAGRRTALARELVLLHAQALHEQQPVPTGPLAVGHAVDELRHAAASDPRALVVRFNLVRTLLHFGSDADANEGDALAEEALAKPVDTWRIAATDDVWPWDFFGTWFNSRAYLDAAIRRETGRDAGPEHFVRLIRASLHYHLAVRLDSLDHAREACRLDPEFPYYARHYARLLLRSPRRGDADEAAGVLGRLAAKSELGGAAWHELAALVDRGVPWSGDLAELAARYRRASDSVLPFTHDLTSLQSAYLRKTRRLESAVRDRRPDAAAARTPPRLSMVVIGVGGRRAEPALAALAHPRERAELEVIYVDCLDVPPWAESLADVAVACRQDGFLEHRLEALARGMDVARGEIIVAVDASRTHVTSGLAERLLTLYFGPGRNAVRASQHVTLPRTTGAAGRPARTPGFVAFPAAPARLIGGVDVVPAFAGDRATPLELAWRLQRFGVPVLLDDGDEAVLHALAPWWALPPFSGEMLHSVSSLLWPGLFDEDRLEPLLSWRQVTSGRTARDLLYVETTASGFNIFRLDGQFVAIRRSLGALDFRLGAAGLARKYGEAHVVVADDVDDVRQRATVLAGHEGPKTIGRPDGPPPAAVLLEYGRLFAVMKVRGRLVAVRHTLGPLNFEMIEDLDALSAAYGPRNVIVDETPERMRDRIRAVVTPSAPVT